MKAFFKHISYFFYSFICAVNSIVVSGIVHWLAHTPTHISVSSTINCLICIYKFGLKRAGQSITARPRQLILNVLFKNRIVTQGINEKKFKGSENCVSVKE